MFSEGRRANEGLITSFTIKVVRLSRTLAASSEAVQDACHRSPVGHRRSPPQRFALSRRNERLDAPPQWFRYIEKIRIHEDVKSWKTIARKFFADF